MLGWVLKLFRTQLFLANLAVFYQDLAHLHALVTERALAAWLLQPVNHPPGINMHSDCHYSHSFPYL